MRKTTTLLLLLAITLGSTASYATAPTAFVHILARSSSRAIEQTPFFATLGRLLRGSGDEILSEKRGIVESIMGSLAAITSRDRGQGISTNRIISRINNLNIDDADQATRESVIAILNKDARRITREDIDSLNSGLVRLLNNTTNQIYAIGCAACVTADVTMPATRMIDDLIDPSMSRAAKRTLKRRMQRSMRSMRRFGRDNEALVNFVNRKLAGKGLGDVSLNQVSRDHIMRLALVADMVDYGSEAQKAYIAVVKKMTNDDLIQDLFKSNLHEMLFEPGIYEGDKLVKITQLLDEVYETNIGNARALKDVDLNRRAIQYKKALKAKAREAGDTELERQVRRMFRNPCFERTQIRAAA